MADRKIRFMVIGKFEKACKDHGFVRPALNKNREQWAADALLESYRLDEIDEALAYYFKVNSAPKWSWFANNMDKILAAIDAKKEDEAFRAEQRKKAEAWLQG
jgi:hypothetical protein